MKVYWWQGGVFFHPESDYDCDALLALTRDVLPVFFKGSEVISMTGLDEKAIDDNWIHNEDSVWRKEVVKEAAKLAAKKAATQNQA